MAQPVPHATYDDLLKAPDHVVTELIDGPLLMSPRPGPRHAVCASAMGGELNFRFDGPRRGGGGDRPGGWWILYEPGLHLGLALGRSGARDIVLVPDLAGWLRERMPGLPGMLLCRPPQVGHSGSIRGPARKTWNVWAKPGVPGVPSRRGCCGPITATP